MYENLRKTLEECGRELVRRYRTNLADNGHIATGKLANTAKYEIVEHGDVIGVEIDLADYWQYVEEGRRSGRFPPIDKILDWIRVKKILPREIHGKLPTEKQLAYLIGRKIAEEGIEGTHDLQDAKDWVNSIFKYRIEMALIKDFDDESYKLMKDAGLFI